MESILLINISILRELLKEREEPETPTSSGTSDVEEERSDGSTSDVGKAQVLKPGDKIEL